MLKKLEGISLIKALLVHSALTNSLLGFVAIQVYIQNGTNQAQDQQIIALQSELVTTKHNYDRDVDELKKQVDYLLKRLIPKISLIIGYQQVSSAPEIWLPIMPHITSTDRRKVRALL